MANKNEPKFESIPKFGRQRIFGTENEFGVLNLKASRLPKNKFTVNGSKVYIDVGHLEYASPETTNPLEALVYEKAGELLCAPFARKLYKNVVDSGGNSFGSHENYFAKIKINSLDLSPLLPFLITRQIFTGAGRLNHDGKYSLSQKAEFITQAYSGSTTSNRGIINLKDESHSGLEGWKRLHIASGDANMCETAIFLKLGTTSLVLDLMEDKIVPKINHNPEKAAEDFKLISCSGRDWKVEKVLDREMKATDIQLAYLQAAKSAYSGRDAQTDEILNRWQSTLEALASNPMTLLGKVDWVTKKALIDAYAEKHGLKMTNDVLRNIDVQYHDIDRGTSLFYTLQDQGKIERLVTDDMIKHAVKNAPKDTRAFGRSKLVKMQMKDRNLDFTDIEWDYVDADKEYRGESYSEASVDLSNPFESYKDAVQTLRKDLKENKVG